VIPSTANGGTACTTSSCSSRQPSSNMHADKTDERIEQHHFNVSSSRPTTSPSKSYSRGRNSVASCSTSVVHEAIKRLEVLERQGDVDKGRFE
jgi:hypothetical protein